MEHLKDHPEAVTAAQKRVDEASEEAYRLALDAIYDMAIQKALMERSKRG